MIKKTINIVWKDRISIAVGILLSILISTYILSLKPPFKVVEKTLTPIIVEQGGKVTICREVDYLYPTNIRITRALIRWDNELSRERSRPLETIDSRHRESGNISICRDIKIPEDTTVGHWVMWTYVETTHFPFWKNVFPILPLNVEVIKKETK